MSHLDAIVTQGRTCYKCIQDIIHCHIPFLGTSAESDRRISARVEKSSFQLPAREITSSGHSSDTFSLIRPATHLLTDNLLEAAAFFIFSWVSLSKYIVTWPIRTSLSTHKNRNSIYGQLYVQDGCCQTTKSPERYPNLVGRQPGKQFTTPAET